MGSHGWVAGFASHGSGILSRGWLVTVEAPGFRWLSSYIQRDAVVNTVYLWQPGQCCRDGV